ncbi:uncharacterized protein LOC122819138 [Drosophila biarmipes]|uniref:uncharacterized protein LOC108026412 n=1 Tax=Drosophila biarmipes TaxID=125945 RepID=UPI0007E88413|nr:uncharacterized protein LOC108026412 [Drosophila biarmipes]XP_043951552.1 uncharacterized protein LOC122819138 [Drosophila biarmipes]
MTKKNKYKGVPNKKKAPITENKTQEETPRDKDLKIVEEKGAEPKVKLEPMEHLTLEKAKKHLDQMSALATMPLRLDHQIQCIKVIQQQLFKLHLQQVILLDGCTDFLQELNTIQPTTDLEEQRVLETFNEVKSKLSEVFEHFLPAQLELLKQETKVLQVSNQLMAE